ncbi:hypothetical protein K504DRAFT_448350 [Pleomassaria siparia CBS 279.74]|uniref:Uncharacterized protein n=1 Tax=Pleomassaria siparia CBS 279.74 TaxID=1314801 RepID=A0A6G1JZE2_9PLEO|nr:hypothetical protein K504DRAFT_448350 [Pleomassaria siparia CBS 279.74]
MFHSQTSASHQTPTYAEPIVQKLIDRVPLLYLPLMPPSSIPAGHSRISHSINPNGYDAQLPKILLLGLVFVTGVRLTVLYCTRRKRRTEASSPTAPASEEKDSTSCQAPPEKDMRRQDSCLRSNDQPASTFTPLYPWISPPQPLPGPYHPHFYPLPAPTIRLHSHDPSHVLFPETEAHMTSYTRRVSTYSIPAPNSTFHGTVTTVRDGPRRNMWTVTGG